MSNLFQSLGCISLLKLYITLFSSVLGSFFFLVTHKCPGSKVGIVRLLYFPEVVWHSKKEWNGAKKVLP
jgi:hypothetical protein